MGNQRYAIWDQLALEVTKFRIYLKTMQEEFETTNASLHKCEIVTQELTQRPIEVSQKMIEFMNSTSIVDL